MKNITVSVPDDVYRRARVRAAERGDSVSSLVAAYLKSLASEESEFVRLEEQQRRIMAAVSPRFRAGDKLSRDELHERGVR